MPRIWDILTEKEKEVVKSCENCIWKARTMREQQHYQKKAELVMERAKRRYLHNKIATLQSQASEEEQAASLG